MSIPCCSSLAGQTCSQEKCPGAFAKHMAMEPPIIVQYMPSQPLHSKNEKFYVGVERNESTQEALNREIGFGFGCVSCWCRACERAGEAKPCGHVIEECLSTLGFRMVRFPPPIVVLFFSFCCCDLWSCFSLKSLPFVWASCSFCVSDYASLIF